MLGYLQPVQEYKYNLFLFGDAIITKMSPKFLCVSVTQSFESTLRSFNPIYRESAVQQSAFKIIDILFLFSKIFSLIIKNMKNK